MRDSMVIVGGVPLRGDLHVAGAKNAALPVLAATILTDGSCDIYNVPDISDIHALIHILDYVAMVTQDKDVTRRLSTNGHYLSVMRAAHTTEIPEIATQFRASILLLGPMLARFGSCRIPMPGGCKIGARPVDFHINALRAMGAECDVVGDYIVARCKRLCGARISFAKQTVTGTANVVMAATLAKGESVIHNAAQEPEILDLISFLKKMGAKIEGDNKALYVQGQDLLSSASHEVISDRIEAMSYAYACAATRGNVRIIGKNLVQQLPYVTGLAETCSKNERGNDDGMDVLCITDYAELLPENWVITEPYPGFPTDLQAQLMAFLCTVPGEWRITETVWPNRFQHVIELKKMGADIALIGDNTAVIRGGSPLNGCDVYASDLRASFALIIAALAAKGTSRVHEIQHLFRGYERVFEKIKVLGGTIDTNKL